MDTNADTMDFQPTEVSIPTFKVFNSGESISLIVTVNDLELTIKMVDLLTIKNTTYRYGQGMTDSQIKNMGEILTSSYDIMKFTFACCTVIIGNCVLVRSENSRLRFKNTPVVKKCILDAIVNLLNEINKYPYISIPSLFSPRSQHQ